MSRELKNRIALTVLILLVIQAMAIIPLPGINTKALLEQYHAVKDAFPLAFLGRAFRRASILSLGIGPYVTASVLVILLLYLFKFRQGIDERRVNIPLYTLGLTVLFSCLQAYGISQFLLSLRTPTGQSIVPHPGWGFRILTMITLSASTLILVWLAQQITRHGIGNGVCLILLMDQISHWPRSGAIGNELREFIGDFVTGQGQTTAPKLLFFAALVAMVILTIRVTQAQWQFPIKKAPTNSNEKSDYELNLPFHFNTIGIFPIVLVQAFVSAISIFLPQAFVRTGFIYYSIFWIFLIVLIPVVTYLWVAIAYNPNTLLRTVEQFYPGHWTTREQAEIKTQLDRTLIKITLPFCLFLLAWGILPFVFGLIAKDRGSAVHIFSMELVIILAILLDLLRQFRVYRLMGYQVSWQKNADLLCEKCNQPVRAEDKWCPHCGILFVEELTCANHPETAAQGICLLCHKPLCSDCLPQTEGRYLCSEHAHYQMIEGWVKIHQAKTRLEAELVKTKLTQRDVPCHILSNTVESMNGTLGLWEISPVIPLMPYRGLGDGEIKVLVPLESFREVEQIKFGED